MKFVILGCGSSMGVPRPDGYFGNCDPKNIKNYFGKGDIDKIVKFMKSDKKNYNNKISLIIIKKIGQTPKIITYNENQIRIFLKKRLVISSISSELRDGYFFLSANNKSDFNIKIYFYF